ncbi:diguanylate cyclase, partial [Streptomyces sp. MCAF7]
GFLRLASPLAEEPVPLGVAWIFQDVTELKRHEMDGSRLRFRGNQLHRAARAAAECEDPAEAATVHLDFALAGFADHALIDLVLEAPPGGRPGGPGPDRVRLVRAAATPSGAPGPCPAIVAGGIPLAYT